MIRKDQVLHVIDNVRVGGAQTILAGLAKYQWDSGRTPVVFCLREIDDASASHNSYLAEVAQSLGIMGYFSGMLRLPSILRRLRKEIVSREIGIVHAHLPLSQIICALLRVLLLGRKVTFVLTPYSARDHTRWYYKIVLPLVKPAYDAAFSILQDSRDIDGLYERVYRIPFSSTRPSDSKQVEVLHSAFPDYRNAHIRILTVSRVEHDKFMEYYHGVFDAISHCDGVAYAFVGYGSRYDEYLALKQERDWTNISFVGYLEECDSVYASADIVLSVSFDSHVSLASMNAMACRRIVVTVNGTQQDKPIRILSTGSPSNYRFISCRNPETLALVVQRLLNDDTRRRVQNLFDQCNSTTDTVSQWEEYERIYALLAEEELSARKK
jgi:glycosyltransferase involved in cell wall biosynthesis